MPRGKPGSGARPGVNAYYKLSGVKRKKLGPYTPKLGKSLLKSIVKPETPKKKTTPKKKKTSKPKSEPVSQPVEAPTTNEA